MLDSLDGFDWDVANIAHIAAHDVTPLEVEQTTTRPYITIPATSIKGESRWKLFGTSDAERYLVVVFTIRKNRFRAVTAYTMNEAERRKYAAQIDRA